MTKPLPVPARRGFALLIVLTLLAFLVLLLVGLASIARVETAVAGNTQRQAQARENALLALNVAVAQLQAHAGDDRRITATADAFAAKNKHFTGVWDSSGTDATPRTWLVSGNEVFQSDGTNNPLAVDPSVTLTTSGNSPTGVELVGKNSSGTANDVVAPLVPITATGIPGTAAAAASTIGRYAWWVGDEGVKAAVGLTDTTGSISYAPFDSPELRSRIRQQISQGAGAVDGSGAPMFEPRDSNNALLDSSDRVTTRSQLAFLRSPSNTAIGLTKLQSNFHAWSPNNFGVLTNTKLGGLRQDLSLDPTLLGPDFAAWANYATYMEDPGSPGAIAPVPSYGSDPLRRRYVMQSGSPMISPVLSFFLLSFNVRTLPTGGNNPSSTPQPVQVRMRGAFTLWNPYSSALVPEKLRLEISGLPTDVFLRDTTVPAGSRVVPFATLFGSANTVKFSLPWTTTTKGDTRQSWLPGRTYSWTIVEDKSGNSPPSGGYICELNSQDINSTSGDGVQQTTGIIVDGSDACSVDFAATTQLTITLIAERDGRDVTLGSFASPQFNGFSGTKSSVGAFTYTPTFVFRLAESDNGPGAWLTTAGIDPRESTLPGDAYVVGTTGHVNGPFPDQYADVRTISAPDRLLDRDIGSFSYDEDVPVFELPRAPLLSIGSLQHLPLAGQRPFAIGNPWAGNAQLNSTSITELFDRFFFSGLTTNVTAAATGNSLLLPNPKLRVLTRDSATGGKVGPSELQGAANAQSSKFLLQSGSFNLNSTDPAAWNAVLRSVRFPVQAFNYLDADFGSGTTDDSTLQAVQSTDAQFFRFAQSAQETFKADQGYAASTVAPSSGPPDVVSAANTDLFRKGMKSLNADLSRALAERIVQYVGRKHSASGTDGGPFRSMESFLAPSALFQDASGNNRSLLEAAIADAATSGGDTVNGNVPEFSSQFLTQADIMTALAPVLFARSDTFVVRAYGEAVNPITNATEGRAWCEATVQRVPEYFDAQNDDATVAPADLTSDLNKTYGRRFKIVSFRWLTRSDI